MDFYYLQENIKNTGLDAVKTASKRLVNKAGEFLENKTAKAVTKLNGNKIV